jgi:hypothetical protein
MSHGCNSSGIPVMIIVIFDIIYGNYSSKIQKQPQMICGCRHPQMPDYTAL